MGGWGIKPGLSAAERKATSTGASSLQCGPRHPKKGVTPDAQGLWDLQLCMEYLPASLQLLTLSRGTQIQ